MTTNEKISTSAGESTVYTTLEGVLEGGQSTLFKARNTASTSVTQSLLTTSGREQQLTGNTMKEESTTKGTTNMLKTMQPYRLVIMTSTPGA